MVEKIRLNMFLPLIILFIFGIFCYLMYLEISAYISIYDFQSANFGIHNKSIFLIQIVIIAFVFIFVLIYLIIFVNRLSCLITVDFKNKVIYRKGFLFGYKAKTEFKDIKEIRVERTYYARKFTPHEVYVILDKSHKVFINPFKKNSPIYLTKSEKTFEIVQKIENELKIIKMYENEDF